MFIDQYTSKKLRLPAVDIAATAALIVEIQKPDGAIPWSHGGKTDPWDHVEAAMGLCIGGFLPQARRAYEWLAATQQGDGSWYAAYCDGRTDDRTRDANLTAYVAVGVYHYYLVTGDLAFVENMWPTLKAATDFAVSLQAPTGEIHWAISPQGQVDPMALLTGSSSIHMSIKCALALARRLKVSAPRWQTALGKLSNAIEHHPQRFNMTKSRYAMDWFYPILAGAVRGDHAQSRIDKYWKKFIIEGQGVRCVSDRPWVTLAETCELVLTLSAMGNRDLAEIVFGWIIEKKSADGWYWCGHTVPDMAVWPDEKTTWTNAAVLLAADSLYEITSAGTLFDHGRWNREFEGL
jgi:MMP endo-(1,4)-3-O-methyl-alpha-D-mannosidase